VRARRRVNTAKLAGTPKEENEHAAWGIEAESPQNRGFSERGLAAESPTARERSEARRHAQGRK